MTIPESTNGLDRAQEVEFECFFRRAFPPLSRTLTLLSSDADDALQYAFLQAFERWAILRAYGDPVGWVRRVAINRLRDAERSRLRSARRLGNYLFRPEREAQPARSAAHVQTLLQVPSRATTDSPDPLLCRGSELSRDRSRHVCERGDG